MMDEKEIHMKTYYVRVTSTNHHDWSIEANSKEDAIKMVRDGRVDAEFWQTDHVDETYDAWELEDE